MFRFSQLSRYQNRPLGQHLPQLRGASQARPVAGDGTYRLSQQPHEIERRVPDEEITSGERVVRILGLDLGQAVDPAAAAMIRVRNYSPDFNGPRYPYVEVCYLRKWPLGYDYCDLVTDVLARHPDVFVPDYGGVGRPVVDMMYREAQRIGFRGKICPVQTASSNANVRIHTDPHRKRQHIVVPKIEIVSCLNIFQQKRAVIGLCNKCGGTGEETVKDGRKKLSKGCHYCRVLRYGDMPETRMLLNEYKSFRMKYTEKDKRASVSFEHRGTGHHGDLAISLGLALWQLTRGVKELACNT